MLARFVLPPAVSLLMVATTLSMVGCRHVSPSANVSSPSEADPFDELRDDNRETVLIEPSPGTETFSIRPAVFDTALVRIGARRGSAAIIEVLVKGSFPDGCTELNELDQEPMQGGQRVSLTMRRPGDAICTQVVRPYRFFFNLDRRFDPGRYTLLLNDRPYAFEVTDRNAP